MPQQGHTHLNVVLLVQLEDSPEEFCLSQLRAGSMALPLVGPEPIIGLCT